MHLSNTDEEFCVRVLKLDLCSLDTELLAKGMYRYGKSFAVYVKNIAGAVKPETDKWFCREYRGDYSTAEECVREKLKKEGFDGQLDKLDLLWEHLDFEEILDHWCRENGKFCRCQVENRFYLFAMN